VHRAANYLQSQFPTRPRRAVVEAYTITPRDVIALSPAIDQDADDYFYSACMSVVDGLRATEAGFYTWSAVKLYYSVFYSLRAILGWDRIVIFHPLEAGAYAVAVTPGAHPVLMPGKGTHKSLLEYFRRTRRAHPILQQDIELVDGLQWMLDKREGANYLTPRFCEPRIPDHFAKITSLGVARATGAYFGDRSGLLSFDKDHAIVSFPLAVLRYAGDTAKKRGGAEISEEERAFLRVRCRERKGALAPVMAFITDTFKNT
jgi:hypothetical protein